MTEEPMVERAARVIYALRPDGGTVRKCVGTTGTRADWQRVFVPDAWDEASEGSRRDCLEYARAALTSANVPALVEALREAQGYVIGNHDEGCELDPEYGEQALERANDEAFEADPDADLRDWPDDAVCTCGTAELLAKIDAALTLSKEGE